MQRPNRVLFIHGTSLLSLIAALWCRQTAEAKPDDRVAAARERLGESPAQKFSAFSLTYPPHDIVLRAFKQEGELELWGRDAASAPYQLIATYPILRASGLLGPKRREGDRQVPEGFYVIDRFNPKSAYHLSLGINYPNKSDRILSDRERPGGDIFIHGKDVTIGCLPMGDLAIEEIYVIASDARSAGAPPIQVHLFPARFTEENWKTILEPALAESENPKALRDFWKQLEAVWEQFQSDKRIPSITVDESGNYRISRPSGST